MAQALQEMQQTPHPAMIEGEHEFAAESVDPLWSTAAEGEILALLSQIVGLELGVLQVECRTTMCRVQLVEHGRIAVADSPGALSDLLETSGLTTRWLITVVTPRGKLTSVAYLLRGETEAEIAGNEQD